MGTSTERAPHPPRMEAVLKILREGEAEVRGLFRLGSNETFLCELHTGEGSLPAVYKPVAGERPLWDFPARTLAKREAAAFEFARWLGWDFVPPTVYRRDGPLGPGSFQEYRDLDLRQNYFQLREEDPDSMRRVAAFDILINNADRKAMHVARDATGTLWLIDHGVCFHREWKLRTVIWDFAGEPLPDEVTRKLQIITASESDHPDPSNSVPMAPLPAVLSRLITGAEIRALVSRAVALRAAGEFPFAGPGISVPWPVWA
jgi:hypothetical protein